MRHSSVLGLLAFAGCNAVLGVVPGDLEQSATTTGSAATTGSATTTGAGGDGGGGGQGGQASCGDGPDTAVGSLRWAHGSSGSTEARATAVALGPEGHVIVGGTYVGTGQIGSTVLPATTNYNAFLATFDAEGGSPIWAQAWNGDGEHYVSDVATTFGGAIAVTGYFEGTISFDGGDSTLTALTPPGVNYGDAFVALFDGSGGLRWAAQLGNQSDTSGTGVAFDATGNLYVAVIGGGPLDFGEMSQGAAGDYGIFLAKYSARGVVLWSRFFAASALDGTSAGLAVSADGGVVVTASTASNAFGSADALNGETGVAVAKYDAAGVQLWSRLFSGSQGSTDRHFGTAVAVDCTGDVLVTGGFAGDIVFDGKGTFDAPPDGNGPDESDIFLAKLEGETGGVTWAKAFHDSGYQAGGQIRRDHAGGALSADLGGNILLSGVLYDSALSSGINVGGGILPPSAIEATDFREDMLLAKFDAGGNHLWSKRFKNQVSGEAIQAGEAVVTPAGAIVAAGEFYSTIDLDPAPAGHLSAFHDMFVASFDP